MSIPFASFPPSPLLAYMVMKPSYKSAYSVESNAQDEYNLNPTSRIPFEIVKLVLIPTTFCCVTTVYVPATA